MRALFSGTCSKDPDEPDDNEDRLAISDDGARVALCDGASESYDSRAWAAQLAERFLADPRFGPDWIAQASASYSSLANVENLSWSRQAAFERGSFSTLLGVEFDAEHRALDILSIGDCVALLVDEGRLVRAWPFDDPDRFLERPTLLSTLASHNVFASDTNFWTTHSATFLLDGLRSPRLYCMSDALGEWPERCAWLQR